MIPTIYYWRKKKRCRISAFKIFIRNSVILQTSFLVGTWYRGKAAVALKPGIENQVWKILTKKYFYLRSGSSIFCDRMSS